MADDHNVTIYQHKGYAEPVYDPYVIDEGAFLVGCSCGWYSGQRDSYEDAVAHAEPGALEHFLVERYRLFAERRDRLITAEVAHEPWPLQRATAELELERMAPPGVDLRGEPLLHFSRAVTAVISAPSAAGTVAGDAARRAPRRRARRLGAGRVVRPASGPCLPADAA